MMIAFFQDAIADVLANPLTKADNVTAKASLPKPMMNGTNAEDSQCWRNEALEAAVVSSEGWSWVDEGKRGRHKYGYVTTTPETFMDFELSTECSGNKSSLVNIGVGHLKSYAKMGLAEVQCVSGCTCNATSLNGTWDSPSSQESWLYLFVTQAPVCRLRVVAKEASNGNVKVKLTSLLKSCIHSAMTTRQQYGGWHQYLHWSELDLDQHGVGKEDEATPQEPDLASSESDDQGSDQVAQEADREEPGVTGDNLLRQPAASDEQAPRLETDEKIDSSSHSRELSELETQGDETGERSSGKSGRHRRGVRTRDSPRRRRDADS
eukprot:jgi/Botrbrau1/20426/Bobra.0487s0001.1